MPDSSIIETHEAGEYTAPVACWIVLMLQEAIPEWVIPRPYQLNLGKTMGEFLRMYWDAHANVLVSPPLPWARLSTFMLIALVMLAFATRITQNQDF